MPVDLDVLAAVLLAALVISVVPGPDMVFVIANGLRLGPAGGAAAAMGVSGGMLAHTAAAVAGLSALIHSSAAVFEAIRWLGVAYLLWLAARALRPGPSLAVRPAAARRSLVRVWGQGAVTNLLNPKVIVFFLAFLPQFVEPGRGDVGAQLLVLGLAFTAVGLAVDAAVGIASGQVGIRLGRSQRLQRALDRVAAVVFVGLALRLVADR